MSERLTKHQLAVLRALPKDGTFVDYQRVMDRRDTRMKLTNGGWTEPERAGAVTMFCRIRITDKGRAAIDG